MIVKCEQCQTRFKIPDDKVTDKGVKVRCTKCSHTFRVTRDMAQPATAAAPAAAPPALANDPFAKFGAPAQLPPAEVTRPGVFALGVEATRASAPAAPAPSFDFSSLAPPATTAPTMPAVPAFVPSAPRPASSAGFDFGALNRPAAPTAPAPAAFDFSNLSGAATQAVPALQPARPPPPPPASGPPPQAFDFSKVAPPAPPAPAAFGYSAAPAAAPAFDFSQVAPPASAAPAPSAFDFSQVAPPAPAAAAPFDFAQVAPPAPAPFDFGAVAPPASSAATATVPAFDFGAVAPPAGGGYDFGAPPGSGGADFGAAPAPGADGFFAAAEASRPVSAQSQADARAMFDMPAPSAAAEAPASLIDVPAPEAEAPAKHATPSAPVKAPAPAQASSQEPARRRSAVGVIINVVIAAVLVVGLVVVGSAYLNEGKLSGDALSFENLKNTFAPSVDFVANDVSNGLYETKAGRAVFFVRGEVFNRSDASVKVVVKVEMVEDGKIVRSGESYAGEPATPEELFLIDSAEALQALNARVEKRALVVPPGSAAAFVVPFTEYPPDVKGFRVRVSARAVAASPTAANP